VIRGILKSLSPIFALTATFAAATSMAPQAARAASASSDTVTMAVRVVGLQDSSGKTTLNQDTATKLLSDVSGMYAKAGCPIQFKLESFTPVSPKDKGLQYNTSDMGELDKYRAAFDDGKSMLIVDTGAWDASMHPANAWTAMPGESKMGAIFEESVADFYQIVGHELGHYLGLDHVDDPTNMMNPVIGDNSTHITADQCSTMQQTAKGALTASRR
jgi:hypothetical protein